MPLVIEPQIVPLENTSDGAIRVVGTRIGLDVIVSRFNAGESPESIATKLATLSLVDVYAVVSFYLRNRETVDAFLADEGKKADELQREIEARPGYQELRKRLLARKPVVAPHA